MMSLIPSSMTSLTLHVVRGLYLAQVFYDDEKILLNGGVVPIIQIEDDPASLVSITNSATMTSLTPLL